MSAGPASGPERRAAIADRLRPMVGGPAPRFELALQAFALTLWRLEAASAQLFRPEVQGERRERAEADRRRWEAEARLCAAGFLLEDFDEVLRVALRGGVG